MGEKEQFFPDIPDNLVKGPVVFLNEVPFVQTEDETFTPVMHQSRYADILIDDTVRAVNQQETGMAALNSRQGSQYGIMF